MAEWRSAVLKFWFGLPEEQWWRGPPELDAEIHGRFLDLWKDKRQLPPESFLDDPLTALAAVLLFDQFPRNMFRGHAEQFATDPLALAIARGAVERKLEEQLPENERKFLYMPFEHSEDMDNQDRSMLLFTALGDDRMLDYAKKHRDIIARFGRFPHRNAILGRAPRADELAAGDVVPW
jgi:uncharacterized protein (DUF924 family)